MSNVRKGLIVVLGIVVVGFIVIQFVPGFARTNPPVTNTIKWDSPQTEKLMRTACYDCHTNETVWPWYSQIAPVSWLVVHDVDEGREKLNLSTGHGEVDDAAEKIRDGSMPPRIYTILHPDAVLTAEQKNQLMAGLQASLGGEG